MGRPARVADVHRIAASMPHVRVVDGTQGKPIYQVGQKSFVFFRNARPDAVDPVTGVRYDDVIVIWVASEDDKQALVLDPGSPYFTTAHFDGHPSVLLRESHVGDVDLDELTELVQDAWIAQTSARRANAWLAGERPAALTRSQGDPQV